MLVGNDHAIKALHASIRYLEIQYIAFCLTSMRFMLD